MNNLFDRPLGRATKLILIACSVTIGIPTFLLTLWLITFIDLSPSDDCQIGSVSKSEYRDLFQRAKTQEWTVWPMLSNGICQPSSKPFITSSQTDRSTELLGFIHESTQSSDSEDKQLAAAHAVMRSINGDYIGRKEIPGLAVEGMPKNAYTAFRYSLPQIRFAPLCILCLIWWDSTIWISFKHNLASNSHTLAHVSILHSGLYYEFNKEAARTVQRGSCPTFP